MEAFWQVRRAGEREGRGRSDTGFEDALFSAGCNGCACWRSPQLALARLARGGAGGLGFRQRLGFEAGVELDVRATE